MSNLQNIRTLIGAIIPITLSGKGPEDGATCDKCHKRLSENQGVVTKYNVLCLDCTFALDEDDRVFISVDMLKRLRPQRA